MGEKLDNISREVMEVLRQQEEFRAELQVMKKILRRKETALDVIDKKSNLPELPIDSEEKLTAFEDIIEDEEEKLYLIAKLAEVGGAKFSSVVHNIMKTLLAKNMALMYSLQGKASKKAFNELKI